MSAWTDERADLAEKLYREGYSASYIASQLGGITRNAVIGKMHRMGVVVGCRLRPTDPAKVRAPRRERIHQASVHKLRVAKAKADEAAAPAQPTDALAKPWIVRRFGECAYPVAGSGADLMSCCAPTTSTYCTAHAAIMYAPNKANESLKSARPDFQNINGKKRFAA